MTNKKDKKNSSKKPTKSAAKGAKKVGKGEEAKIVVSSKADEEMMAKQKLEAEKRERILNYCRMHQLRERGTHVLLAIFHARWAHCMQQQFPDSANLEWIEGKECGDLLFKMCTESKTVLQGKEMKEKIRDGKSAFWDITLLAAAIQAVTQTIQKANSTMANIYGEEDKQIAEIRAVRNEISHKHNSELDTEQFDALWQKLAKALLKIGSKFGINRAELDRIKSIDLVDNNSAQEDPHNAKAAQLKMKANEEYKEGKYEAAIATYAQILELPGIPSDFQATIFSNRSVAYLFLKNTSMAKRDAKMAIQMRPSWWRAYYRLGCAYQAENKMQKTLIQFETALALNPDEKSTTEKLYQIRQQFGIQSREEHLVPHPELLSEKEQMEKLQQRFTAQQLDTAMAMAEGNPYFSSMFKGHRYRDGLGVKQDYVLAAKHYAEAARRGNPEGMYNLAKLHDQGLGVPQDYQTSIFWLRKAAAITDHPAPNTSGVAHAQHSLGLKYTEGVGVKQDLKEAASWYEKAVKNNFGPSANNLGLFYKNGTGVERSLVKAFVHFQMAADWNDTPGMTNLGQCYLLGEGSGAMPDKEKALHWYCRAASAGDLLAERKIRELEQMTETAEGDLHLKFQTMMEPSMPEGIGFKDSLKDEHQQFIPAVRSAAEQGSVVAKEVLIIWGSMEAAMEAFKRGDEAGMIAQLAKAIQLDHQLIKMPEMFKPVVQRCLKVQSDDIDTIIAHIGMSNKDRNLPEFIDKCLQKYPQHPFLMEMRAVCLIAFGETKEAINFLEAEALRIHPNNIRLLYVRATAYSMDEDEERIVNDDNKTLLKAWDDFMQMAPKEHPKMPTAYYRKAFAYVRSPEQFIQCFEEGLAAEKLQLPCFLPYDFPPKYQLEKMVNMLKLMGNEGKKENKAECSASNVPSSINYARREHAIANPRRKLLLNKVRTNLALLIDEKNKSLHKIKTTTKAPKVPKPPSLIGLKEIMLGEMEPDNIYNRSVLELKIIDWPIVMTSVMMVVEDMNGHVEKLAIYNWPESDNFAQMFRTFRPQRTLSIINPYLRIAMDADRLIRVDDPAYVILGELPPAKMRHCSCCGIGDEAAKILKCSKCEMAFYCSKECQKLDWHEFGHKLVCKHLGKYAAVVFGQQ